MAAEDILVTAKINPDLDGVSCTLAYAELLAEQGKQVDGIVTGSPQSEVQYFIENHGVIIPQRADETSNKWSSFILVDASSMKGMPNVVEASRVVEVIDHRAGEPEKEFPNAQIQNELIGAAATIVVERFIRLGQKPSFERALLLYGAIFHNTLNFVATNATNRDWEAVEYLKSNFGFDERIIRGMFDFATHKITKDIAAALVDDAKEFGKGWKVGAYQLIVWGNEIFADKEIITKNVSDLGAKMDSDWAFVNIVDLETKESHIYVESDKGQTVITEALGVPFNNGWAILPAILRKQIMPKVNAVLDG